MTAPTTTSRSPYPGERHDGRQGRLVPGWSDASDGATVPYAVNSVVSVPADLDAVNAFVVRTELVVNHQLSLFGSDAGGTIPLSRTSYYRQRFGTTINCTDC